MEPNDQQPGAPGPGLPGQPGQPQAQDQTPAFPPGVEVVSGEDGGQEIQEPAKLLRIALMLREMQEEVRRAAPDNAGRDRLRIVHERALEQMKSVLSDDLQDELTTLTLPFEDGTPTESEIRIAQAQLLGWLEGLFQGIQAAIFNQQLAARAQLEQMRQRGLPHGMRPAGGGEDAGAPSTGHYL